MHLAHHGGCARITRAAARAGPEGCVVWTMGFEESALAYTVFHHLHLVGRNPLTRRIVFVCYLDDSNNENGPNLAIGGYVTTLDNWIGFEYAVHSLINKYEISLLRGTDFHSGRGSFKGWAGEKKMRFVDDLYGIVAQFVPLGIVSTLDKSDYKRARAEAKLLNVSPLGAAFAAILGNLVFKDLVDILGNSELIKLNVVVECGNKNNGNLVRLFHQLKSKDPDLASRLGSVSFVGKHDCRAVQLADFLAFHARRGSEAWSRAGYGNEPQWGPILNIMNRHVMHRYNRVYGDYKEMLVGESNLDTMNPLLLPDGGVK